MKTLLGIFTVATLASISSVQADVAGVELGAYRWTPDYKGTFSADSGSSQGTTLDIRDDLGFTDDSHNIIWVSLEHPIPFLPNVKLVQSDLATSASSTLTRDIEFNGQTYSASEDVDTTFDMSNTEYTFYYEVLDNWVNLDLGLTLRQYDGEVRIKTDPSGSNINEYQNLDFTVPLFYAKGRVDLPFTGFFIDGQINIISYNDDKLSDTEISLGYESEIGLGARLGYRTFDLDVVEDDFNSDLKFDGTYLSVFYHF